MNGRIYDPTLGRFLQADPHIQAPENSQSFNRYSYVLNNPLSYTDPSGYFFKAIGKFVKKYWKTIVAIAASYVTFGLATGAWSFAAIGNLSAGALIGGGAAAGFVSGAISTGSLRGALQGAFSGAVFGAIGGAGLGGFEKFALSGFAGGVMQDLQGGKFGHGFISAGVSAAIGGAFGKTPVGRILGSAIVGGTISKLTGGKFANGALTAAFAALLRADWDTKQDAPDFANMSREEKVDWIMKNKDKLGIKMKEGTEIDTSNVDKPAQWLHGLGPALCDPSGCSASAIEMPAFYDGHKFISLFDGAFTPDQGVSITYTNPKTGALTIGYIGDVSEMEQLVYTMGHEASHTIGVDMNTDTLIHPESNYQGLKALKTFRKLYGN